jgi:hypothetical protein
MNTTAIKFTETNTRSQRLFRLAGSSPDCRREYVEGKPEIFGKEMK